jgi:acyl-CoA dehydrogenase
VALENGVTANLVIAHMRGIVAELERQPALTAVHGALTTGVTALETATDWLVATYPEKPAAAAASAAPYLQLFGTVAGGWPRGRAALVAQKRRAAKQGDAGFYRAKIATANFYAEHMLPQAAALAHTVIHGSASTLALDAADF